MNIELENIFRNSYNIEGKISYQEGILLSRGVGIASELFKDSNIDIYKVKTPSQFEFQKLLLVIGDLNIENVIGRVTSNGSLEIYDYEKLNSSGIKIQNFNNIELYEALLSLTNLLVKMKMLKSFDKSFFKRYTGGDASFTVSKNKDFIFKELFLKKFASESKNVCVSNSFRLCTSSVKKYIKINFFNQFEVTVQPFNDGMLFNFYFIKLSGHCRISNNNISNFEIYMKTIIKDYLYKEKNILLDMEYIFTDDFFDYCSSVMKILDY